MGVYSLEAAEMYAAKNRPAINESFAPYENPILEYGIKSIRADFALFEAQLELDFKEYYDTLNEAEDKGKEEGGTTVNVNNTAPDPEFDAKKRAADNAQDKAEKEEADKEKAAQDASKGSKFRQTLGKMKIDSGTIAKFGEFLKRLWNGFVNSLKGMLNRLIGGFQNFIDKNGEKFNAAVAKINEPGNLAKYEGEKVAVIDPAVADGKFKDVINEFDNTFKDLKGMSVEDVDAKIKEIEEKMQGVINSVNSSKADNVQEAAKIINASKGTMNQFKQIASAELNRLIKFGEEKEREANNAYSAAVRDNGQEAADKDSSLQINKEKAQKVAQLGNKLGAEYGKLLSSATGSVTRAALGIVANIEGKTVKQKAAAVKNTMSEKAAARKAAKEQEAEAKAAEQPEAQNASAVMDSDDFLLTEAETAIAIQAMVEDTCDINFDECFEF